LFHMSQLCWLIYFKTYVCFDYHVCFSTSFSWLAYMVYICHVHALVICHNYVMLFTWETSWLICCIGHVFYFICSWIMIFFF